MYDLERAKTVWELYQQGVPKKQIARLLKIDPKTVRTIIKKEGKTSQSRRSNRIELNPELLESVYHRCDGWIQRVHEILTEEHHLSVAYSTLTKRLREMGLSAYSEKDARCEDGAFHIKIGEEMQHDTSPYIVKLSGKPTRVTASGLYLRYSKMRYVRFYLSFDRFAMKCFITEALSHWRKSASVCIIDNTNLAVLRGTGEGAVMVPEMAAFAKSFGFTWKAHRLGHSNRKGGKERNFWTLETNFFPGREFKDLSDLNQQAFEWATVRYAKRPQSDTKLIPIELFEQEKLYLLDLPPYIEPPYRILNRWTDRYGYVGVGGNLYWVPGKRREQLKVIEYAHQIKVYRSQELLIEYLKVAEDQRGKKIRPPEIPETTDTVSKKGWNSQEEEQRLRQMGKEIELYLDWLKTPAGAVRYKNKFIRELEGLSRQLSVKIFLAAIMRAHEYGINDIHSIERIASQILHSGENDPTYSPWEQYSLPLDYENRSSYRIGCFVQEPEMSSYGKLLEGKYHDKKTNESEPKE